MLPENACLSCPVNLERYPAMKQKLTIAAVATGVVYALLLYTAGRGALGYFSPQTLEICYRSEKTIHGTGIPIYRSRLNCYSNELVTMLIEDGYVTPQQDAEKKWMLINHWNSSWKDGHDALYRLFSMKRDQIMAWTRGNPETAKVYWSQMFRYLRSDAPNGGMAGRGMASYWREFKHPDEVRELIAEIEYELGQK